MNYFHASKKKIGYETGPQGPDFSRGPALALVFRGNPCLVTPGLGEASKLIKLAQFLQQTLQRLPDTFGGP